MALQWEQKSDKLTVAPTPLGYFMVVKSGFNVIEYSVSNRSEILGSHPSLDEAKVAAQEKFDDLLNLSLPLARRNNCREALKLWSEGQSCPSCGYDCSAANPPVNLCPLRELQDLLKQN